MCNRSRMCGNAEDAVRVRSTLQSEVTEVSHRFTTTDRGDPAAPPSTLPSALPSGRRNSASPRAASPLPAGSLLFVRLSVSERESVPVKVKMRNSNNTEFSLLRPRGGGRKRSGRLVGED